MMVDNNSIGILLHRLFAKTGWYDIADRNRWLLWMTTDYPYNYDVLWWKSNKSCIQTYRGRNIVITHNTMKIANDHEPQSSHCSYVVDYAVGKPSGYLKPYNPLLLIIDCLIQQQGRDNISGYCRKQHKIQGWITAQYQSERRFEF